MPIYAYRCTACGHAKDVLQRLSDPLLTQCPVCGADAFRKQLTAAGFQLKGSGWYVTDFKGSGAAGAKEGQPADKGADKPAADKPAPAAKTEAAPAAAPAAASSGSTPSGAA